MTQSNLINVTLLVLAMLAAGVLVVVFLNRQQKQRQLLGIQWLQALRFLLMHVQKHRGLSAAFISGNRDVEHELSSLKHQISKDIDAVAGLGEWISSHEDWLGITQHWARLGGGSEALAFSKSFSQHCKLIANILALMDTVAEHHNIRHTGINRQNYVLWHEFLWVGELIGQCRALGVRILALRTESQQLVKHKKQIEKALRDVSHLLDHPFPKTRVSAEEVARIHSFIEFVKHNLIEHSGMISANEYFNQATQTIAVIYECFDREIQMLHRKIAA